MVGISEKVWDVFSCPPCSAPLAQVPEGARCTGCETLYPYTDRGSLDLRPQRGKRYELSFEVGAATRRSHRLDFAPLRGKPTPEVDFSDMPVPHHLNPELLSHIPRAGAHGNLMLDLGCGTGIHQEVGERAGYEWVGIDYDKLGAPLYADAHVLPFADRSFDFILSIAVLEHIRYPFVMMREAYRVLKPGGTFIGTVAFCEPFHEDSYYHHTHLATVNSLEYGGFDIQEVAPSRDWPVLRAQAAMGLFPEMPSVLARLIVAPVQLLHRLWWRVGRSVSDKATEQARVCNTTGSFTFIASRSGP